MGIGRYNVQTEKATEVLKSLDFSKFLETHPSYVKYMTGDHFKVTAVDQADSSVMITFGHSSVSLIRFYVQAYPACCGIMMLHHFIVNDGMITQEQADALLEAFFAENKFGQDQQGSSKYLLGRNNRIEVVMVETRTTRADWVPSTDIEPVESPNMQYQYLWNFFHKFAKKVNTRLMYNNNSHNVLHNMEVVLF